MPGLGASFGFGACTNFPRDMRNSDCILVMGSNMAESHPVGFQWVMEAKERGATLIHVDPRFTRTSAVADHHISIRPDSDLAFLGALIHLILKKNGWFADFVSHYTNASTLVSEKFSFDENTGLFVGFNPATRSYDQDPDAWDYEMDEQGMPKKDPTFQHPRCVLRVLEKQYAGYTPERAAETCGCSPEDVELVADLLMGNSGPERTSVMAYALGWTQHTSGVQIIRAAGIIQLLLGNVGRPGSGIVALRGHANVQGATDIPTLFNNLPNYIPQPKAIAEHATLKNLLEYGHGLSGRRGREESGLWRQEGLKGAWAAMPSYMVSLLKAWYGDAATADNEYCYQNLPKMQKDESEQTFFKEALQGTVRGMFVFGQNPAVSSPNSGFHREAMRKLDWLVVVDAFETESAAVWYADPDGPGPETVGTEVFLLPAALAMEKGGSVSNTERLVQWHEPVLDAPGDSRSDLWYVYQLGKRLKALYADSTQKKDKALQQLTWDYCKPGEDEPDPELVLREMNGFNTVTGEHLKATGQLAADGSTACGCRLYCGVYPAPGQNLAKRRGTIGDDENFYPDWAWAWPGNSRILYNRASADPAGKPWSERKAIIHWDANAGRWKGADVPNYVLDKAPDYRPTPESRGMNAIPGDAPFTVHFDGLGWLFAPFGLSDGPMPVHYEALETPVRNTMAAQQISPSTTIIEDSRNAIAAQGDPRYPVILTSYRVTEQFVAGVMTRRSSWINELQPSLFFEMDPELAASLALRNLDWVIAESKRGSIEGRVLVTPRIQPLMVCGNKVHVVGVPMHFGYKGEVTGDSVNVLTALSLGPNSDIASVKSIACRIRPGRLTARSEHKGDFKDAYAPLPDAPMSKVPWICKPEGRLDYDN
ncbi:molybdopterin-dependent oxidoreductase [Desulfovibrio falkowii]|uniref:molybdopterin-dependent oxidoreductase n=1 Tax=Desulfovibrio falkowii TaxID=3136602 RepID=UPI0038B3C7FA